MDGQWYRVPVLPYKLFCRIWEREIRLRRCWRAIHVWPVKMCWLVSNMRSAWVKSTPLSWHPDSNAEMLKCTGWPSAPFSALTSKFKVQSSKFDVRRSLSSSPDPFHSDFLTIDEWLRRSRNLTAAPPQPDPSAEMLKCTGWPHRRADPTARSPGILTPTPKC